MSSTLKADGAAIERRIEEMKARDASISYGEICNRTGDLGAGFIRVDEKTLYSARKGGSVMTIALQSLARVLGVDVVDIVVSPDGSEPAETMPPAGSYKSNTAISAAGAPAVIAEEHSSVSISINGPAPEES